MRTNKLESVMAAISTDLGYQISILEHPGTRFKSSTTSGMVLATHPYYELVIRDQEENQEVIGSCFLSKNELESLVSQILQGNK